MPNNWRLTAENADHANGSNELYTAAHKLTATPLCIFMRPLNGRMQMFAVRDRMGRYARYLERKLEMDLLIH